jgi:hypothetical protein
LANTLSIRENVNQFHLFNASHYRNEGPIPSRQFFYNQWTGMAEKKNKTMYKYSTFKIMYRSLPLRVSGQKMY